MGDVVLRDRAARADRASPLAEIAAAVGFLTRVPVPSIAGAATRTGASAFGLVGAGLGVVASVPIVLLGADHPLPSAILAIGLLAVLDGGLHLDGLADTLDAVAAPPGSADRARTDPRAGTAGVIAIAIVLGLDAAALAELAARGGLLAPAALVAAAVVSRVVAPLWAVTVGRRLRPSSGLGAWFADATSGAAASVALASAVLVVAILVELAGPRIVVAAIGGGLIGSAVAAALVRLRRQLDGDGYGALIEATLSGVLLAAMVVG